MQTNRKGFLELLQRYLSGRSSSDEKQAMDFWYDSLDQEDGGKGSSPAKNDLEEALWQRIDARIQPEAESESGRWRRFGFVKLAAAIVVLIAGLFYVGSNRRFDGMHRVTNTGQAVREVRLEDGSRIQLYPGSSIHYPKLFSSHRREVFLTGDAFFDVTKNPARPFLVYTGDVVTRVLGTRFSVRHSTKDVEVAVNTGKVVVEKATEKNTDKLVARSNGVLLTPNQKVTYHRADRHFVTGLVDNPMLLEQSALAGFQFEGTPLSHVLNQIERAYGLEIVLVNEKIHNCPFTADLSRQPLYTKLDVICAALKAEYDIKGTRIFLTGGNCF